jgi:hypothetical protein
VATQRNTYLPKFKHDFFPIPVKKIKIEKSAEGLRTIKKQNMILINSL